MECIHETANNKELTVAIIAIVISVITLIVSSIISIYAVSQSKKMNKTNLSFNFLLTIFEEHLVEIIPDSYRYIRFDVHDKLTDTVKLRDALLDMLNRSRYYKFTDKEFYKELKEAQSDLENYLVTNEGKLYEQDEQAEVWSNINGKLCKIYKIVENKQNKT